MRTGVSPYGVGAAQEWSQVGALFNAIDEFEINLVIELGVYMGGLSELLFLRQGRIPNFRYLGFEISKSQVNPRLRDSLPIIYGDIFTEPLKARVVQEVNNTKGHVLIFCDDGDKPKEMTTYAPLIRSGDLLMAHDFSTEVTIESLVLFAAQFPYMYEIEPEKYHAIHLTLWRKK